MWFIKYIPIYLIHLAHCLLCLVCVFIHSEYHHTHQKRIAYNFFALRFASQFRCVMWILLFLTHSVLPFSSLRPDCWPASHSLAASLAMCKCVIITSVRVVFFFLLRSLYANALHCSSSLHIVRVHRGHRLKISFLPISIHFVSFASPSPYLHRTRHMHKCTARVLAFIYMAYTCINRTAHTYNKQPAK